ncbi:MAG: chemotaxis protein CheD [Opitutaceae bacterium]|jgi:chemotaxis protein CheD
MKLPDPKFPQHHLQPGELLVTQEPIWVVTLLGSCVAVTMFNSRFRLSAICHAMLPKPPGAHASGRRSDECFRYVSHAIPAMAERFARLGLEPAEVEVKMFGGGNVIDLGGNPQGDRSIGDANVALATQLLREARFQLKGHSVGGNCGRKIAFNTHSGEVLHKHLSRGATKK